MWQRLLTPSHTSSREGARRGRHGGRRRRGVVAAAVVVGGLLALGRAWRLVGMRRELAQLELPLVETSDAAPTSTHWPILPSHVRPMEDTPVNVACDEMLWPPLAQLLQRPIPPFYGHASFPAAVPILGHCSRKLRKGAGNGLGSVAVETYMETGRGTSHVLATTAGDPTTTRKFCHARMPPQLLSNSNDRPPHNLQPLLL